MLKMSRMAGLEVCDAAFEKSSNGGNGPRLCGNSVP